MVPVKFRVPVSTGPPYTVLVNVYAEDGTVAITHGGVEVGQGVDTKVAQVAAMELGVPMVTIKIKPCSTVTNPNSLATGGSTTSELCCQVSQKVALQMMFCVAMQQHSVARICLRLSNS